MTSAWELLFPPLKNWTKNNIHLCELWRLSEKCTSYVLNIRCVCCIWLFASPWTVACQSPLSMEFSRQEFWNGLPFPSLGDLPHPGIEPVSLSSPALAGGLFTTEPPRKPLTYSKCSKIFIMVTIKPKSEYFPHSRWPLLFLGKSLGEREINEILQEFRGEDDCFNLWW